MINLKLITVMSIMTLHHRHIVGLNVYDEISSTLLLNAVDVYTKDSPSIGTISDYEQSSFDGDSDIQMMPIEVVRNCILYSWLTLLQSDCNLITESVLKFNRRWHYIKEPRSSASPNIYSFNPDISSNMRCKLVNWLIEVFSLLVYWLWFLNINRFHFISGFTGKHFIWLCIILIDSFR